MNDKHYTNLAIILALIALILASAPITMPILSVLFDVGIKHYASLDRVIRLLVIYGWIFGLLIAIIAHKMGKHMKGSLLLINTTRIASALAMLGTLCWGIFVILAMILHHFSPRGF